MPARSSHAPSVAVLDSDRATLDALKDIPTYAPFDAAHSTNALIALETALREAEAAAARAQRAYDMARAELYRAGWAFHDGAVCARLAVKAQFGVDSHEVHAVGLTRSSERKRPARRVRPTIG